MDLKDFLDDLYESNNYPAKVKLLQLAKQTRPETTAKDVDNFLNGELAYQLLKETKNLKSNSGHIVAYRINEIWQIDYMMSLVMTNQIKDINICLPSLMSLLVLDILYH